MMPNTIAEDEKALPFGKHLASSDKKIRDKAIHSLETFLADSAEPLPKADMAKLWKGIFYCFWMSDKPLVQQSLATDLAEILLSMQTPASALAFLQGFWEAIVHEWSGIDRLRIDKYYMLIRRFVNASFRLLARCEWEDSLLKGYNSILTQRGGPLCPDDMRVSAGLPYHLADIYLEELDKASANPPVSSPLPTPLGTLLGPFLSLAALTPTKATFQRIQSALIDPLLEALSQPSTEDIADNDGLPPAPKRRRFAASTYHSLFSNACSVNPRKGAVPQQELKSCLLNWISDVAGEETTKDASKKKLLAICKNYSNCDGDDDGLTVFS